MARLALAAAGGVAGGLIGGPMGARIGWTAGALLGNVLFQDAIKTQGPRLSDLKVMAADEGADLPAVWGSYRVGGTVIWTTPLVEEEVTESTGGKGGPKQTSTTYRYTVSMAVALAEGEIDGVRRIWADSKLIYSAADDIDIGTALASGAAVAGGITIYRGTESQTADPTIQADLGAANTPAFRGTAYIVFTDMDVGPYGNRRPNITAEVVASGTETAPPTLVADFDGTDADGIDWGTGQYKDGVLIVPTYSFSANTFTTTRTYYDLAGNKIGEQVTQAANELATASVSLGYCKANADIAFVVKDAAGTDAGVGRWIFKGRMEGYPEPVNTSTNYYHAAHRNTGAMHWWHGRVYVLCGPDGKRAIARYPTFDNGAPKPNADLYLDLEPYLSGSSTGDIGQISIGDDDLIYVAVSGNVDNATHDIIILDEDLGVVDYITLPGTESAARYALWISEDGQYIGKQRDGTFYGAAAMQYWDISDPHNPSLLNETLDSDIGLGNKEKGLALVNGLYAAANGIWSFRPYLSNDGVTLQSIVDALCGEAGIGAGNLNTTALAATTVHGYTRPRRMSARAALEPLRQAYFFDLIASDDKLKAVLRGATPTLTLTADDLVASDDADKYPIEHTMADELTLPVEVSVGFAAKDNDYQPGARRARRFYGDTTNSDEIVDVALPIAMSSGYGAQIAEILLRAAWAEAESLRFRLPPKWLYLEPSDVIRITLSDGTHAIRIVQFDVGANYEIDVTALKDFGGYTSSAPNIDDYVAATIPVTGPTLYEVIDIACLRDQDDSPGYYVAMTGVYSAWPGAILFSSPDGGSYAQVGAATTSAHVGVANTTLSASAAVGLGYDTCSAVVVNLFNDALTLASVTESEFLAGDQVALIGDEIVAFKDVTDNGDGTYTLQTFIRGLAGTEDQLTEHSNYDRFVLLTGGGIVQIDGSLADTDQDKYLKFVTIGASIEGADREVVTLENMRITPIQPAHFSGSRALDTTGAPQWLFTWVRQARLQYEWLDLIDTPDDEDAEEYEIDILDEDGAALRTIEIADDQAAVYTNAQMIADFGHAVDELAANLYQMSARVGRGKVAALVAAANTWTANPSMAIQLEGPLSAWEQDTASNTKSDLGPLAVDLVWNSSPGYASSDTPYVFNPGAIRVANPSTTSHYAVAANTTAWSFSTDITVFAWIKSTQTPGATAIPFLCKWDTTAASSQAWRLGWHPSGSGKIAWTIGRDSANIVAVSTNSGFNDGAWHLVVGVREVSGGTGAMRIYVDGTLQTNGSGTANSTLTDAIRTTTVNVTAVRHANLLASDNYVGLLGAVGFFDYALTAGQIQRIYNRARLTGAS